MNKKKLFKDIYCEKETTRIKKYSLMIKITFDTLNTTKSKK